MNRLPVPVRGGRLVPEGLDWEGGFHWHGMFPRVPLSWTWLWVGSRNQVIRRSDSGESSYMLGILVAHLRNILLRTPQRLFLRSFSRWIKESSRTRSQRSRGMYDKLLGNQVLLKYPYYQRNTSLVMQACVTVKNENTLVRKLGSRSRVTGTKIFHQDSQSRLPVIL